jgi:hypothetical protein
MPYGKTELKNTLEKILDTEQVEALGVSRAVEEAAIQLFLNDDAHEETVTIIKESLTDIRIGGNFKYADNPALPDIEDSQYCLGCGNDDRGSMTYESNTASGTQLKCECGEHVTFN